MLRFRGRPREPPATATGSKSLIFIGVLFKIEGRPFRVGVSPGAVLGAKIEPKWTSESMQKLQKTHRENHPEYLPKSCRKRHPELPQNGTQIH